MQPSESSPNPPHPELTSEALTYLVRPLTVRQVSRKLGITLERTDSVLRSLRKRGSIRCLNPGARRSRVYIDASKPTPAEVDWELYGWLCFSQRRAVVTALDEHRSPAAIKRRARYLDSGLRMSANNVRDVVKELLHKNVVEKVEDPRRSHPIYRLTRTGLELQRLILQGEARHQ